MVRRTVSHSVLVHEAEERVLLASSFSFCNSGFGSQTMNDTTNIQVRFSFLKETFVKIPSYTCLEVCHAGDSNSIKLTAMINRHRWEVGGYFGGNSVFSFETPRYSSIVAFIPVCIPNSRVKSFPSPILSSFYCLILIAILTRVRWNLYEVLIRISLIAITLNFFHVFIGHLYFLF